MDGVKESSGSLGIQEHTNILLLRQLLQLDLELIGITESRENGAEEFLGPHDLGVLLRLVRGEILVPPLVLELDKEGLEAWARAG